LLDRQVELQQILNAVNELHVDNCRGAILVGIYEGANIATNKKSITIRIEYRSDERTLRDEEVEDRHARLTASLLKTFSAEKR